MTDSVANDLKPNAPAMGKGTALPPEEIDRLTDDIVAALKTVYDPEIPSDIYELGLIYRVDIADDRQITIDMTLTAPGCPVAGEMPGWATLVGGWTDQESLWRRPFRQDEIGCFAHRPSGYREVS